MGFSNWWFAKIPCQVDISNPLILSLTEGTFWNVDNLSGDVTAIGIIFFDCIKGSNEGVFGELNKILQGEIKSWEDLDRATKKAYIENWNTFFQKWTQENLGNPEIQRMKSAQLTQAIVSAYKSRPGEPPVPKVFEEYLSTQFFPSLVWKDYGFNSDNSANPQGGRRTRYKKKRNRKITRRNRNKNKKNKSLKAR